MDDLDRLLDDPPPPQENAFPTGAVIVVCVLALVIWCGVGVTGLIVAPAAATATNGLDFVAESEINYMEYTIERFFIGMEYLDPDGAANQWATDPEINVTDRAYTARVDRVTITTVDGLSLEEGSTDQLGPLLEQSSVPLTGTVAYDDGDQRTFSATMQNSASRGWLIMEFAFDE